MAQDEHFSQKFTQFACATNTDEYAFLIWSIFPFVHFSLVRPIYNIFKAKDSQFLQVNTIS